MCKKQLLFRSICIEKDINNLPKYYVFLYLSKAQKGRILVSFDIVKILMSCYKFIAGF